MDIQSASVKTSLAGTREEAAVRIQALGLSAMKDQSAALAKLMESAWVNDPNLGRNFNITV